MSRLFVAGLVGTSVTLFMRPVTTADCISSDKQISMELSKLKRRKAPPNTECAGLMLALLACYKSYNFVRGKCDVEEKALTDCTIRAAAEPKKKDTIRYHIARLMRRR